MQFTPDTWHMITSFSFTDDALVGGRDLAYKLSKAVVWVRGAGCARLAESRLVVGAKP